VRFRYPVQGGGELMRVVGGLPAELTWRVPPMGQWEWVLGIAGTLIAALGASLIVGFFNSLQRNVQDTIVRLVRIETQLVEREQRHDGVEIKLIALRQDLDDAFHQITALKQFAIRAHPDLWTNGVTK